MKLKDFWPRQTKPDWLPPIKKEGEHSCSNCKGKSLKYQAMNEMMDKEHNPTKGK